MLNFFYEKTRGFTRKTLEKYENFKAIMRLRYGSTPCAGIWNGKKYEENHAIVKKYVKHLKKDKKYEKNHAIQTGSQIKNVLAKVFNSWKWRQKI